MLFLDFLSEKQDDFNFYDKRLYVKKKGFDYQRVAWNSYFGRSSRIFSSLSKEEIPGISWCASGEAYNVVKYFLWELWLDFNSIWLAHWNRIDWTKWQVLRKKKSPHCDRGSQDKKLTLQKVVESYQNTGLKNKSPPPISTIASNNF